FSLLFFSIILTMGKIFLSVVIPSFDEMANLQKGVLDKIEHFLGKKQFPYEVIIVDDGSTDGSVEFAKRFVQDSPNFRLMENSHLGKAGAVTAGVLNSKGDYVLFSDMDQATPIEELDKLLPYLEQDFDIVVGSRDAVRKGAPLIRQFVSHAAIVARKLVVGMPEISDTQCGFKAFKKEAARKLFTRISKLHNGFKKILGSSVSSGFDVELLYLAKHLGYKIKEVPVEWLYVETRRVSPIKDSVEGFMDLLKIKIKAMRGEYN
ncbi:MAG: Glycosyl transferase family 2, partial [Candidatus Levybacteria bacterium GW2011_GWC2_37_7]